MSQLEEGFDSILRNNVAVSAIVSTRIRPGLIAQKDDLPAIVYRRTSGEHEVSMAGMVGLAVGVLDIECWAISYTAAKSLRDRLRLLLHGKKWTAAGVQVRGSFLEDDTDVLETGVGADQQRRYGAAMTATLWYQEATV